MIGALPGGYKSGMPGRESFHYLNNFGEAICMIADATKGSSEAVKVLKHKDSCIRCLMIVRKVRRDLVWQVERRPSW